MIDLHCHLLAGIDDGPATIDESVAMAQVAADDGVRCIVCTPHVDHDHPRNTPARINEATVELQGALDAAGIPLRLQTGAEIALARALELPNDTLHELSLAGSGTILLELPIGSEVPRAAAMVRSLTSRGHGILLAHPERSLSFHQQPALLAELVDAGCLAQLTASALEGSYGRTVRGAARDILAARHAHVIASDGHSAERRAPRLAATLQEAGLADLITQACDDGPQAVIAGQRPQPLPSGGRGLLGRLRRS